MIEQWESVVYSALSLQAGVTKYSLFEDSEAPSDLDFRMEEKSVIDFLMHHFQSQLARIAMPDMKGYPIFEIMATEPWTSSDKVPGDVDIVVIDSGDPQNVAAIEVKVLRKRPTDQNPDFVSGFGKIERGALQVNGLSELGFAKVYLAVVVLANTSSQRSNGVHARQIDDVIWSKIVRRAIEATGETGVGIVKIEINMNTARSIHESGQVSGITYRASIRNQTPRISEIAAKKIREKIKHDE